MENRLPTDCVEPVKRLVWIERVRMGGLARLVRADHWAVRVGEDAQDCHEVAQRSKRMGIWSITSQGEELFLREGVDGSDFENQNRTAKDVEGTLTLSGTTTKTDEDISDFIKQWIAKNKKYNLVGSNCQTFARDLVEALVGGSYQPPCPLPQASVTVWSCKAGEFEAKSEKYGFEMRKCATGKVGGIWHLFGFEMEGPMVAKGIFSQMHHRNWGPFADVSLFRIEAKCVPLRIRLVPNLNSCFGVKNGQLQLKLGGFGISIAAWGGVGFSTPLGGVGLGRF